jgi:hypothetical protein
MLTVRIAEVTASVLIQSDLLSSGYFSIAESQRRMIFTLGLLKRSGGGGNGRFFVPSHPMKLE